MLLRDLEHENIRLPLFALTDYLHVSIVNTSSQTAPRRTSVAGFFERVFSLYMYNHVTEKLFPFLGKRGVVDIKTSSGLSTTA